VSVLRETTQYGAGMLLAQVISAFRGLLVAGYLGPQLFGLWKVLQVALDYLGYCHLGLQHGMARLIPLFWERGEGEKERWMRSFVFGMSILTAVIAGGLALVLTNGQEKEIRYAWVGIAAVLVASQLFRYLHMVCLADGRFALLSISNVLFAVIALVMMTVCIPESGLGWGLYGVFAGLGVGYGAVLLLGIVQGVYPRIVFRPERSFPRKPVVSLIFRTGFPFMAVDGLFVVWQGIDRLGLAWLFGAKSAELGYYGFAATVASFAIQVPQVVTRVMFRRVLASLAKGEGDDADLGRNFEAPAIAFAGCAPLIYGLGLIVTWCLIRGVPFLQGFRGAEVSIGLLLLSAYWCGIGLQIRNVFIGTDRMWRLGVIYTIAITATVAVLFIASPIQFGDTQIGIAAGGLGMLVGSIVFAFLSIMDGLRILLIEWKKIGSLLLQLTVPFIPYAIWTGWMVFYRGSVCESWGWSLAELVVLTVPGAVWAYGKVAGTRILSPG